MGRPAWGRGEPVSKRHSSGARSQPPGDGGALDACIQCNLCVRACREVQVNDVIGMAARGHDEKIVFDFDDPMGNRTCVACGECVQACPTGALMPASLVDEGPMSERFPDREVDCVCPYCGVGCQLTYKISDEHISPSTAAMVPPITIGSASRAASVLTMSTIRTG